MDDVIEIVIHDQIIGIDKYTIKIPLKKVFEAYAEFAEDMMTGMFESLEEDQDDVESDHVLWERD